MYCHKCGAQMPETSLFCARCGTRLLAERNGADARNHEAGLQPNPKQVYFQKLAKALTKDGFKIDPRLLEKSDAAKSMEGLMKTAGTISNYFLGPLGGLIGTVLGPLSTWGTISGEELYTALEPIAVLFDLVAAQYKFGIPVLAGVIDADEADASRAGQIAGELCRNLKRVKKKGGSILVNCLYVCFDEEHCLHNSTGILKKGQGYKSLSNMYGTVVYVWPIVVNVPAKKLEYRKLSFQDALESNRFSGGFFNFSTGLWAVSQSALYETLVG